MFGRFLVLEYIVDFRVKGLSSLQALVVMHSHRFELAIDRGSNFIKYNVHK